LVKEEREQHVSRDKATSHICSNQALQALRCSMYLALMGEEGFKNVAKLSAAKAHYLCGKLCELPGVKLAKSGSFFNEFLLEISGDVAGLLQKLRERGIFGGIDFSKWDPSYGNHLLVAVTEIRSKQELDRVVEEFKAALLS
jgi:glycine dehydrogenase subunit 1